MIYIINKDIGILWFMFIIEGNYIFCLEVSKNREVIFIILVYRFF